MERLFVYISELNYSTQLSLPKYDDLFMFIYLFIYLFIFFFCVFDDAISSSDYENLNDKMIDE
jgi:hypothetical protein